MLLLRGPAALDSVCRNWPVQVNLHKHWGSGSTAAAPQTMPLVLSSAAGPALLAGNLVMLPTGLLQQLTLNNAMGLQVRLDPGQVNALVTEADEVAERWLAVNAKDVLAQQVSHVQMRCMPLPG